MTATELGDKASHNVLILGLDGVRGDCVVGEAKDLLLKCAGELVEWSAKTSRLTVSEPAWTSALTGHWPHRHGVEDDFQFWNHAESPSLFAHLAANDRKGIVWAQWKSLIDDGLKDEPCELRHFPTDEEITADCCASLRDVSSPWSCYFVHLDDPDHTGHIAGFLPTVPEYVASIHDTARRCDRICDALLDRIKACPTERWLVIMTTDHGGGVAWPRSHGDDAPLVRDVFLHTRVYPESAPRLAVPHPVTQIIDVFHLALHYMLPTTGEPLSPAIGSKLSWNGWSEPSTADEHDYSHHKEWSEAWQWYMEHHRECYDPIRAPKHLSED